MSHCGQLALQFALFPLFDVELDLRLCAGAVSSCTSSTVNSTSIRFALRGSFACRVSDSIAREDSDDVDVDGDDDDVDELKANVVLLAIFFLIPAVSF